MFRALAAGTAIGLGVFVTIAWAFAKGCPVFDVEHDTILGF